MNRINPNWQVPTNIHAFTSTRESGFSTAPYAYANLGTHVGDETMAVFRNRNKIAKENNFPTEPKWLNQTHSTQVVMVDDAFDNNGDAAITRMPNVVLAIQTADCLPILLTNRKGTEVAAIHAGWRGLCNGIIEKTVKRLSSSSQELIAWIGPSICGQCFEVGVEVIDQFYQSYPFSKRYSFYMDQWHLNLSSLSVHILREIGVCNAYQSKTCTFEQKNSLYSYRRDGQTGRMGTFIWFE